MMGTMVPFSDNAVKVGNERLRFGDERAAEVNQHRQRRIPRTSLDLREVFEADARALCDVGLRQSEPVSHLAHTPTEHEAYPPVARVVLAGTGRLWLLSSELARRAESVGRQDVRPESTARGRASPPDDQGSGSLREPAAWTCGPDPCPALVTPLGSGLGTH